MLKKKTHKQTNIRTKKKPDSRAAISSTASKQRPFPACVSELPVHAEPFELMLMTANLHPGSTVAMTHESHTLHPIYHLNYFHFHIAIYFFMWQMNLYVRQIACP